jgi:hypothetical protein
MSRVKETWGAGRSTSQLGRDLLRSLGRDMRRKRTSDGCVRTSQTSLQVARDRRLVAAVLIASIVMATTIGLCLRLETFPGLHGDEAWTGLRALAQQSRGMFTLNGMNRYTGSLFPEIVAMSFSMLPPGVGSLRLPGVLLNCSAQLLMAVTLWRHGASAICFALLLGSSLLFLFYSRVAWEVNALQNLLLAIIFLALTHLASLASKTRTAPFWIFLVLLAFSIGCWNHAIFVAAALSFAAATSLVVLGWPNDANARLQLVACTNLLLQTVLAARHLVHDGPFVSHALPTMAISLLLIVLATLACICFEAPLLPRILGAVSDPRVAGGARIFIPAFIVFALVVTPTSSISFLGTVSGVILLERVASYMPGQLEMAVLHLRMAILLAIFGALTFSSLSRPRLQQGSALLPLLVLWTIAYFPALRLATPGVADRYYIIPQFLFFCSIALAVDNHLARWRAPIVSVLVIGFIYAQLVLFREATRDDDRPPFEVFNYGDYADTSQHFLRLRALTGYLRSHAMCRAESSNYFIAQPIHFLMAIDRPCAATGSVRVEYCPICRTPVPWFELRQDN